MRKITLAHLLPDQPCHHRLNPLLPDNRILRRLESVLIVVVYAVECRRDFGLSGEEGGGFGRRHCAQLPSLEVGERIEEELRALEEVRRPIGADVKLVMLTAV